MENGGVLIWCAPVEVFNDDAFSRLRFRDSIPHDFLSDASSVGRFRSGGGKGGDLLAISTCRQYIIKQLNLGDHESLLKVAKSYVDRVVDRTSLLCPMYLHFRECKSGRFFVVMLNMLAGRSNWSGLYDLKGCADDKTLELNGQPVEVVHKRVWNVHMWCGKCMWSQKRMTYYQGKVAARNLTIFVSPIQRIGLLDRLKLDTSWLAENNLMDYSLLVGICRISRESFETDPELMFALRSGAEGELTRPIMQRDGKDHVLLIYVGIIDFLQQWTFPKAVAQCIKTLEKQKSTIAPMPYAKRFFDHFDRIIEGSETQTAIDDEIDDSANLRPLKYYSCLSLNDFESAKAPSAREIKPLSQISCFGCFAGPVFQLKDLWKNQT